MQVVWIMYKYTKIINLFSKNSSLICQNDSILNLQINHFIIRIKYMGHSFPICRRNKVEFNHILENMKIKLNICKVRLLSIVKRRTLINSIVQTMPIHSMSTFKLPTSFCESIDFLMIRFWWKDNFQNS